MICKSCIPLSEGTVYMLYARLKESNIPFVVTENSRGYHWCWDAYNNALSSFYSWEPKCTVLEIRVVQVAIESKILLGKRFLQVCAWIRLDSTCSYLYMQVGCLFVSARMLILLPQSYLPLFLTDTLKMDPVSIKNTGNAYRLVKCMFWYSTII